MNRIVLLVFVLLLTTLPLFVVAQEQQLVPCDGPNCNLESFVTLVQNLLNFLVYLAVIGAALLFAWAGWLYLSSADNVSQRVKATKVFKNVAIGLIIMIGAWVLIDSLLEGVLRSDFKWNSFEGVLDLQ